MKQLILFAVISFMVMCVPFSGLAADMDNPLPAWETEEEAALRALYGFPNPKDIDTPPTGTVESYPEWAPAEGVLISWMGFPSFLTDMTGEFVQVGDVFIAVESASHQSSVESQLTSAGISLDNVEFLTHNMDTVWMIDFGPFFINVDGNREIADNIYDRYGRDDDDAFPGRLGTDWSIPVHSSDLRIEGGNFIADGDGICFITDRVIEQNNGYLTEQEVYDRLRDYCGCETVHVLDRLYDPTGHIDMFAKLLDADTMLLGQYDSGDPEYNTLEDNATFMGTLTSSQGTPYEIIRIPMPGNPNDYWTYTNSLIVNDHVFVPTFNIPGDAEALMIYSGAMPGFDIVGIDSSSVIGSGGAVHCTTRVVPTAEEYNAAITDVVVDDSAGDNDGLLDPGETVFLQINLRNSGSQPLTGVSGVLSSDQPGLVTILDAAASWPDLSPGSTAASLAPHFQVLIDGSTPEGTVVTFSLDVSADGYTVTREYSLTVTGRAIQFFWDLDTDPGWTTENLWAYGQPLGQDDDPSAGYTGTNVYGYNLSGTYTNNMPETNLTTTAIDCSDLEGLELRFMRWLGVESASYDHASLDVSSNGTTWTSLWDHTGSTFTDGDWQSMSYDISAVADGQATVYLRWVMGTTDTSVIYCGWNIDDIEIWGVSNAPEPTPTPACVNHGDVNFDGTITAGDAQLTFQIALGAYSPTPEEACAADCTGDGNVTAGDAQAVFIAALGVGTCADPL